MERDAGASARNFGVFAHIDGGKTTLTERILLLSGRIREMGNVDRGDTETDYLDVEKRRGITVKAAATFFSWRGVECNLIDTPGHVDFSAEVARSLRALDGAVLLACGVSGSQSQLERIWRQCSNRRIPRLLFINKLDRRGASYARTIAELSAAVGDAFAPVVVPALGPSGELLGVIDVVEGRYARFPIRPGEAEPVEAPGDVGDALARARDSLMESLAMVDGACMERYLAGLPFEPELAAKALAAACRSCALVPCACGSALEGLGVDFLLDAIVRYLPDPRDSPAHPAFGPSGEAISVRPESCDPFSAFVFGAGLDKDGMPLSFIRLRSGSLARNDVVLRTVRAASAVGADGAGNLAARFDRARVKGLYRAHVASYSAVEAAYSGDLVALSGIPDLLPGDTLCDPGRPLAFERPPEAESVVSVAVEPKTRADAEGVQRGLSALAAMDPSLAWRENRETGQFTLSGVGELQLEVALERLKREFGARARWGEPEVAYRETVDGPRVGQGEVDFDRNGKGIRATVTLRAEPAPRGSGLEVVAEGMAEPVAEAIGRGIRAAASAGPLHGFRVVDVRCVLVGAAGDSKPESYEAAAALAFGEALRESSVLEPYGRFEIEAPPDHLGALASAVANRQGRIESVEDVDSYKRIEALMPMRLSFGFASEIRSLSGGRASLQCSFSGYESAPKSLFRES
jgi:elongation factor G